MTTPQDATPPVLPRLIWLIERTAGEERVTLDRATVIDAVHAIVDLAVAVESGRTWLGALRPEPASVEMLYYSPGLRRRLAKPHRALVRAMERVVSRTYGGPVDEARDRALAAIRGAYLGAPERDGTGDGGEAGQLH